MGTQKNHLIEAFLLSTKNLCYNCPAVETEAATTTEEIWAKLKTGLLKTTEEVCGTTKPLKLGGGIRK